jgi:SAM-dependent methyltransferase
MTRSGGTQSTPTYVFALSQEAQRLEQQGHFLAPFTRRVLEDAGISSGMKVLDIGCGAGDVALLLAELVGPKGTIVGVDRNPAILEIAWQRVQAAGVPNVSFVHGDILASAVDDDFDAAVGRLVLVHTSDPVALLRQVRTHVRPGGVVVFQEPDHTHSIATEPRASLFEQAWGWWVEATRQAGLERQMGLKLFGMFVEAGLPAPEMRLERAMGGGPAWGGYDHLASLVRGLLPRIVQGEIATADEVAIETLAQRLRDEVVSQRGVVMGLSLVSAWTRTRTRT